MRQAVFLDRDGTINREVSYLSRPQEVELLPGAGRAIAALNSAGLAVVVVSNQSGLARGLFDENDLAAVQAELQRQLAACGAAIDGFYYCPHLPQGPVERYATVCDCRKPHTGLVMRAKAELGLSLSGSFLVGDRLRDIACGRAAGLITVLVQSGHDDGPPQSRDQEPHHLAADLAAAVSWILTRREAAG